MALRISKTEGEAAAPVTISPVATVSPVLGVMLGWVPREAGWPWALALLLLYGLLLIQVALYLIRYGRAFQASLSSPVPKLEVTPQKRTLILRTLIYTELGSLAVGYALVALRVIPFPFLEAGIAVPLLIVAAATYAFAVLVAYGVVVITRRLKASEEDVQFGWLLGFLLAGFNSLALLLFVATSAQWLWRLLALALCLLYFSHLHLRWRRFRQAQRAAS